MANSNRKKTRKLHEAKQAKKAEDTKKEKSVRKAKADIEKQLQQNNWMTEPLSSTAAKAYLISPCRRIKH